jgi:hypothetical protein
MQSNGQLFKFWSFRRVHWALNTLTPNGLYSGRAVSPLNSRMATKEAANSVLKSGAILFTPIRFSVVVCYASGLWKVMLCFRTQNVPPHPLNPLINTDTDADLVTALFFQLTSTVLTLGAFITTCSPVHCVLKYQHWPIK